MLRLPDLVGSPLSVNALREDLQVNHKTVESWLAALERLYAIFRISPMCAPRIRAVRKAQKHYHFDWTLIQQDAMRYENLTACHLLKWVHCEQDVSGRDLELRYFRDRDGHEVDRGLRYLLQKFPAASAWQISATGTRDYQTPDGIRVAPATTLLTTLV